MEDLRVPCVFGYPALRNPGDLLKVCLTDLSARGTGIDRAEWQNYEKEINGPVKINWRTLVLNWLKAMLQWDIYRVAPDAVLEFNNAIARLRMLDNRLMASMCERESNGPVREAPLTQRKTMRTFISPAP